MNDEIMTLAQIISNANASVVSDKKIKKILLEYSPLSGQEPNENDIEELKKYGLYIGCHELHHDKIFDEATTALIRINRDRLAEFFLASIATGNCELRGGLISYAILSAMPKHNYMRTEANNCHICCSTNTRKIDLTFFNSVRIGVGCFCSTDIYELCFGILMAEKTIKENHYSIDCIIFKNIISAIRNMPDTSVTKSLISVIRDQLPYKHTTEQIRSLIDMFGILSILETKEHQGFLTKYTNLGLAPRKSRSSDWAYPVDWWTGEHGVNDNAVQYWFGKAM